MPDAERLVAKLGPLFHEFPELLLIAFRAAGQWREAEKGCFNPETWDFDYGQPFTRATEDEIIKALRPSWIQGLSILGGEPAEEENAAILIPFLKRVRAVLPNKDIWLYSGYTYEVLRDKEILTLADVLVDGPFLLEQKDAGLAFRGSRNQRIIDLREK